MYFLNTVSVAVVTAGEVTVVVSQPNPKKHKKEKIVALVAAAHLSIVVTQTDSKKQNVDKTASSVVVNRLTAGKVSVVVSNLSKKQKQK